MEWVFQIDIAGEPTVYFNTIMFLHNQIASDLFLIQPHEHKCFLMLHTFEFANEPWHQRLTSPHMHMHIEILRKSMMMAESRRRNVRSTDNRDEN